MTEPTKRRALVSGASIAGPTLGYWLAQSGWGVTVVERASSLRGGGYPIDLRGTAVVVAERMGIYNEVCEARQSRRSMSVLNPKGRTIAALDLSADVFNDESAGDVELARGELARILYAHTHDNVEYAFNESVATITPKDDRVDVTFVSGRKDTFDIVVGADGIHSTTRQLVFGPESDYIHHLGQVVAIWDADDSGLEPGTGVVFNTPGCMAAAIREPEGLTRGMISFTIEDPASVDLDDMKSAARLAHEAFGDAAIPLVDRLLNDLAQADDVYFDTVSQIRMGRWHKGRVVLVGDSAFAPSFKSGQGTSMAVVGAYVLASELATNPNPERAFAAYTAKLRDFVEDNQAIALGSSSVLPLTSSALRKRNLQFRMIPWIQRLGLMKLLLRRGFRDATTSLDLDGYGLTAPAAWPEDSR